MKSTPVAYLLWLLGGLGVLGLHRFYLGRWVSATIWLLTGGLFLVGAVVDLFMLAEMVRIENLSRQLLAQALLEEARTPGVIFAGPAAPVHAGNVSRRK